MTTDPSAAARCAGSSRRRPAYRRDRAAGCRRSPSRRDAPAGTPSAISSFTTVMARATDNSQLDANAADPLIGCRSVWPSTRRIHLMSGGISLRDVLDGDRERGDPVLARLRQVGAAQREQHLALEHEPIADDLDPRAVGQHLAQLAEEFAAIALQLLHLGRQRGIQLLARDWRSACPFPAPVPASVRAPWRPTQAAPSARPPAD